MLFRQSEFGDTAYIIRSGRVGYLEEEDDMVPGSLWQRRDF